MQQIESEQRRATPDEQRILARYVGWGGLPQAFRNRATNETAKGWESLSTPPGGRDMAVQPQGCLSSPYHPRRPADTPLYRVVQNHLETFLALCHDDWEEARATPHAERELRRYLECGILAYGFARARCDECGHDVLIAFSCKGRGICPSCNTRRMAQTAAHLADHVLPHLPVRQWVLSLPKRLRYHLQVAVGDAHDAVPASPHPT